MPGLTIPTGYENQQIAIKRRAEIAQQMLEIGLQGAANEHMTSPLQALGAIAQQWAGHSELKKSDSMQADLNNHIRDSYLGAYGAARTDTEAVRAGNMTPTEWLNRHGTNPLLADQTKSMGEVEKNDLQRGGNITRDGGFIGHERDIPQNGMSLELPDPNKPTMSYDLGNGKYRTQVNDVGVGSALMRQGLDATGYPTYSDQPLPAGTAGSVPQTGGLPAAPQTGGLPMPGQDPLDPNVLHFLDALKQRGAAQSGSGMFPNPMSAPGQMTSGRRTVWGNAAVGGVPNSHHLDGDAADYVGATPEDLQEYFGNRARVLNEGNHVHVTLPGYGQVPYFGRRGTQ